MCHTPRQLPHRLAATLQSHSAFQCSTTGTWDFLLAQETGWQVGTRTGVKMGLTEVAKRSERLLCGDAQKPEYLGLRFGLGLGLERWLVTGT